MDEQPVREPAFASYLFDHLAEARRKTVAGSRLLFASPAESVAETLFGERLEKIVEGVHLEGAKGVLIVGRYEDDVGHLDCRRGRHDAPNHTEAIHSRHLHVQENEIRVMLFHGGDGGFAAVRLRNDFDTCFKTQQAKNFSSRRGFVIDNEHAE
jgi:hypothetical protein